MSPRDVGMLGFGVVLWMACAAIARPPLSNAAPADVVRRNIKPANVIRGEYACSSFYFFPRTGAVFSVGGCWWVR